MTEELSSESRIFGAVSYVFGLIITVLIFLLKKDDKYIKYHAAQAIVFDIVVMVISSVLGMVMFGLLFAGNMFFVYFWVVWLLLMGIGLVLLVIRLIFAWMAYTGSQFRIPIISNFADKLAEK